jgi:hypothetical protein
MNAVTIPADLHAWAEAEVAAGRAMTVEQVTERALRGYRSQLEQLRQSLDDAEAEEAFADIKGKLDVARDQIARGEALEGDAFLSELDSWIAQDLAAEPKV